jgi:hypothetical protein
MIYLGIGFFVISIGLIMLFIKRFPWEIKRFPWEDKEGYRLEDFHMEIPMPPVKPPKIGADPK